MHIELSDSKATFSQDVATAVCMFASVDFLPGTLPNVIPQRFVSLCGIFHVQTRELSINSQKYKPLYCGATLERCQTIKPDNVHMAKLLPCVHGNSFIVNSVALKCN